MHLHLDSLLGLLEVSSEPHLETRCARGQPGWGDWLLFLLIDQEELANEFEEEKKKNTTPS